MMEKSIMKIIELKKILKQYKDEDLISLYCSDNNAELRIYYGNNQNLEKVIMRDENIEWI